MQVVALLLNLVQLQQVLPLCLTLLASTSRCKSQLLCASLVVMVQARQTLRGEC